MQEGVEGGIDTKKGPESGTGFRTDREAVNAMEVGRSLNQGRGDNMMIN